MGQIQVSPALMKMRIHWEYILSVSALFPSVLYVYHRILENLPTFGRSSVVAYEIHYVGPLY